MTKEEASLKKLRRRSAYNKTVSYFDQSELLQGSEEIIDIENEVSDNEEAQKEQTKQKRKSCKHINFFLIQ